PRRIAAHVRGGRLELPPVVTDLPGEALERSPGREQEPEPHARRHADRAVGCAGEKDRRVRLLQRMREQRVVAIDLESEVLAAVVGTLGAQQLQQERQRLLLDVAPALEIRAESVELVFASPRAAP